MFYPCSHPIKIRNDYISETMTDFSLTQGAPHYPMRHPQSCALLFVVMRTHLETMNLFGHFHEKRETTPGLNYPRDRLMRNMRAQNYRNNEKGSDGLQRALYCTYRQN